MQESAVLVELFAGALLPPSLLPSGSVGLAGATLLR